MFYDQSPPKNYFDEDFPNVNKVVTVPTCWYYLSLLERFVDITKDMPEDVLKLYLVRAEYRYFQWISKAHGQRTLNNSTPPIDVAFFWQAHSLSPVRYYEDCMRCPTFFPRDAIPLKQILDARTIGLNDPVIHEWGRVMQNEPYDLAEAISINKHHGFTRVTCIVCLNRIKCPWKDYVEWRTDHSTALQCRCCLAMFTVKHVGKANFLADNAKSNTTAGLLVNERGYFSSPIKEHELLLPLKKTKELPFNRGLKPLDELMKTKETHYDTGGAARRERIIDAIQSTYLCTPYRGSSIDLIQAVARQYKFAFKVTKNIDWKVPDGIINGIRRYADFFAVMKDNPSLTAVPTIPIDLAWHTHMLHHSYYHDFCIFYFNKMINHDDTIPEKDLQTYVEMTDEAWKKRNDKRKEAEEELKAWKPPQVEPVSVQEVVKPTGLKGEIKSIFTKKRKNKAIKSGFVHHKLPPPSPSNGYVDKKVLFSISYNEGKHENNKEYWPTTTNDNNRDKLEEGERGSTTAIDEDMLSDENKEKNCNAASAEITINVPGGLAERKFPAVDDLEESNAIKIDKNDIIYDKSNISYHDRRDIKDFIELNNDENLMDETFARVKISNYGFIGTSTCANTDYLDQWSRSERDEMICDENGNPLISRYSAVFLTSKIRADDPVFSVKGLHKVNELERTEGRENYGEYYQEQNIRYNTAGDNFNWYLISATWNECNQSPLKHSKDCGGWNNCTGSNYTASNCAGISSAGVSAKFPNLGSGGATSSSCGFSSSCGSSSGCGGGGTGGCGGGGE